MEYKLLIIPTESLPTFEARSKAEAKFNIINIGDKKTPKGKFDNFHLRFSSSRLDIDDLPEIPSLNPSEEFQFEFNFIPAEDGIGWINFNIKFDEEESSVKLFIDEKSERTPFSRAIYVINKETFTIIELLKEISHKLSEISEKLEVGTGG
ncbi:MAG: hypothetical protein ACTSQY_07880 [Candidatus Odinarchaeia archaeon]